MLRGTTRLLAPQQQWGRPAGRPAEAARTVTSMLMCLPTPMCFNHVQMMSARSFLALAAAALLATCVAGECSLFICALPFATQLACLFWITACLSAMQLATQTPGAAHRARMPPPPTSKRAPRGPPPAGALPAEPFANEGGPEFMDGATYSLGKDGKVAAMGIIADDGYVSAGVVNGTLLAERAVYSSWECDAENPGAGGAAACTAVLPLPPGATPDCTRRLAAVHALTLLCGAPSLAQASTRLCSKKPSPMRPAPVSQLLRVHAQSEHRRRAAASHLHCTRIHNLLFWPLQWLRRSSCASMAPSPRPRTSGERLRVQCSAASSSRPMGKDRRSPL